MSHCNSALDLWVALKEHRLSYHNMGIEPRIGFPHLSTLVQVPEQQPDLYPDCHLALPAAGGCLSVLVEGSTTVVVERDTAG